jgi:hypothetical protein
MIQSQNYAKSKTSDLPYIALILSCCIIAYWPVSFFVYSLKNDALNYFLPVRFQVSEAIRNGFWPFWSPYFNLGYPLHGDMQSGVWNPIVQIFSLFGPYTLRMLHYETLLYIFISGIGMFYLLKYFAIAKNISLLIAVSYMLCGYNSDSTQFLNWISSASFLPFVVLFSFRAIDNSSWKASIPCGIFIYLFFVTAYPADFILLLYLLLIFFCWMLIQKKTSKQKELWAFAKKLLTIGVVFILLALPAVVSFIQSLPLTERGFGTSYEQAMSNPFHPILFLSYITPLPFWKASFVAVTDPLERNSYFGLIVFAFFLASFFIKQQNSWLRFCKWGFLVSAIFSLGEIGGVRSLAYYVLPLMNTFRHPANAKIFAIFFACAVAAFTIQQMLSSSSRKALHYSLTIISSIILLLLIWSSFGKNNLSSLLSSFNSSGFIDEVKLRLDSTSFYDLLLFNAVLQLPFLLTLYLFRYKRSGFKLLLWAGIINGILHTILFSPFTVVKNSRAAHIETLLTNNISKLDRPDLNVPVYQNSRGGDSLFKEIGALNMYNKKIGRIDYRISPSNLNNQNLFWNENRKLRNFLLRYPLLYKADTVLAIKDSNTIYSLRNKKAILVNGDNAVDWINFLSKDYSATIIKFTPNRVDIKLESSEPGIYCLFQNYYPNWKLFVDEKEETIIQCNVSFMGFKSDKGTHTISFRYEVPAVKIAFFISLFSLCCLLLVFANYHNELIKNGKDIFPVSNS